jgi:hypothetical protein
VYLQPGSAVFSSAWYAGLSTATPAASCASACLGFVGFGGIGSTFLLDTFKKKLKNMDESDETNSFFHADGYRFW